MKDKQTWKVSIDSGDCPYRTVVYNYDKHATVPYCLKKYPSNDPQCDKETCPIRKERRYENR